MPTLPACRADAGLCARRMLGYRLSSAPPGAAPLQGLWDGELLRMGGPGAAMGVVGPRRPLKITILVSHP